MSVAIVTTTQDVYPPRVQVAVTGLTVGDAVEVYRVVAGQRTLIRGGASAGVTDTSFVKVDAELPFGVPVSYVAVVNGADGPSTSSATYSLPGGKVALSDAISGLSAEVTIIAWPDKPRSRPFSSFRAGGRNIVVQGQLSGFSTSIDVYTEFDSSADNVNALVESATQGIIQIRRPTAAYRGVDCYVAVTGINERRWSQKGSDQARSFTLDVIEAEGWAPALEARGFTLQDIADVYAGLTLQDLANDYATLLDISLADWS